MLVATIGVSEPRRAALHAAGQAIPKEIRVTALVDTGASCTCVDPSVMAALGLTPTGMVSIQTPSTGGTPHHADQYDVCLRIMTKIPADALYRATIPVVASDLKTSQGFEVLLGRDILQECLLVYDGQRGVFSFAY